MKKMLSIILAIALAMLFYACSGNKPTEPSGPKVPTVTTSAVSAVTQTTAQCGGNVTSDGGASITARGICWSTSPSPTISDSKTADATGTGSFTSAITGLTAGTTYYVRAYATNSAGTGYGSATSFTTTSGQVPSLTTPFIWNVTSTTFQYNTIISNHGNSNIIDRGVCWGTNSLPTVADNKISIGPGYDSFEGAAYGLQGNTKYFVRTYATNEFGTGYSTVQELTTLPPVVPELTTSGFTSITQSSAVGGGNITSDGGAPITVRGVCWSSTSIPTVVDPHTSDGNGNGSFTSFITGLTGSMMYSVRAYATNSAGTGYGDVMTFNTAEIPGFVVDIDGNRYPTVTIGTQTWMAEDLRTKHYNDGSLIFHLEYPYNTGYYWIRITSGAYYPSMEPYGYFYNRYAVITGILAPVGWHVPSDAEWQTLIDYLGGNTVAGGKLKEAGTAHWDSPNTGATNESGFSALPGGQIVSSAGIIELGWSAYFWSTTPSYVGNGYGIFKSLNSSNSEVNSYFSPPTSGYSVRCVKD